MNINMKKYLLSLFIVPLLLIGGFSSAYVYQDAYCYCDESSQCVMRWADLPEWTLWLKSLLPYTWYSNPLMFLFQNPSNSLTVYWDFYLQFAGGTAFSNWVIMFSDAWFNPTSNTRFQAICEWNWNWNMEFHYQWILPDPPLVPWWTANFTPVITGLTSSINEFIPYVVYIGLWVLWVLISFVAIKWLINWVRSKIFSSFK